MTWDSKKQIWHEDEWLCEICECERTARDILWAFSEGRPFDDNRESKITRYFGKRKSPFSRGEELSKGDPKITEHEWMRYAPYKLA